MANVQNIFGIKESSNGGGYKELRQSIEQTEDYAVKQVIHVTEIYVDKFVLDKTSNSYFKYNHTTSQVELYVGGVLVASW